MCISSAVCPVDIRIYKLRIYAHIHHTYPQDIRIYRWGYIHIYMCISAGIYGYTAEDVYTYTPYISTGYTDIKLRMYTHIHVYIFILYIFFLYCIYFYIVYFFLSGYTVYHVDIHMYGVHSTVHNTCVHISCSRMCIM
jgi:hypothetical protein